MLADDAKARTQGLLAVEAVLTGAIADAGVDEDHVAWRDMPHVGTDFLHDAGAISAQDPRWRDEHAGKTANLEQVETIERRRANADEHVCRAMEHGLGQILAIFDLIEAAVRRYRQSSHGFARRLYCSRMLCDGRRT